MMPYIHIFGKTIPMYGLLTMVGVLAGLLYFKLRERNHKELSADFELSFVYGLLGAVVGAKLLSIVTVLPDFIRDFPLLFTDPISFLSTYLLGGFVFYGGFYGCLLGVFLYCRVSHVSFDTVLQVLLPVFPLIHGFGRLGCLSMGCCYGKPAGDFPLAIVFQHSEIAPNGVPLLPVQLMEALMEFVLFALLAVLSHKRLSGRKLLGIYCCIYSIARFLLEYLRGDEYRGFLFGLSTSQIISIFTLAFALFLLLSKQTEKKEPQR